MKIESQINARWVITVDTENRVLENHSLLVQSGKIVEILPTAEAQGRFQAKQTFDLSDHVVMPGLINAHTHASMALLKGFADDLPLMEWLQHHIWPVEGRWMGDEFVYAGSQLAIAEMLRSGTTCFNDMYFYPEATARAVDESGIRAALGMILLDFPTAHAQDTAGYFEKAQVLRQQYADHPLISTLFAPHAPYTVSDEPLTQMLELNKELSLPVHMHVHETESEVIQSQEHTGQRPLTRLAQLGLLDQHFLAVHMTQLDDDEIALLAEKGTHVVHCPESNLKLASGFCPLAKLLKAGVNVALGTDGNASNNDLDMLGELRTAVLLGKGVAGDATAVPAPEALRMATINGAKALGIDETTGSLETGKAADIIAIDLSGLESRPLYDPVSHLVYCISRNQISYTWVNGRLLMENRQLLTLDEQQLLDTAQTWQDKLTTGNNDD